MYYKILTHDFRPPVQGGEPIWDGKTLPVILPTVRVDRGPYKCGCGWNFVSDLATGFWITGLWPNGRPLAAFEVIPIGRVEKRGDKYRAASIELVRLINEEEIATAVRRFSEPFAHFADAMAAEQLAWRFALARPHRDQAVEAHLSEAVRVRGLSWDLRRFDSARDAWAAWDAWDARDARDARAARDAWAARDARDARAAWDAWDARDARAARDARDARDARAAWDARAARDAWDARAARDAWDARAARDAWAALTVYYAASSGWIKARPDLLTTGLRPAYVAGLELAVPTGPNELGWA